MASCDLVLSDYLFSETELPQPDWEDLAAAVADRIAPEDQFQCWTNLATQWLHALNESFGGEYDCLESDNFLLFGYSPRANLKSLARDAEICRQRLLDLLPGLAEFHSQGKQVVLIFTGDDAYYAHVSHYQPEGEFGRSGGMHIRDAYSHVVVRENLAQTHTPLAHELTHAALSHLELPQWIEEGLAQLAERDANGLGLDFDYRKVRRQKRHWRKYGLKEFWSGEGFSRLGKTQDYSYQLAEILMRLFLADYKPRWFGLDRRPLQRFLTFLREASVADAGQAAAIEHLGITLGQHAAKSLGPGDWEPAM